MFSLLQDEFGKCFENLLLDIPFLLKRKHHCCASKSFKLFPHEMKEGLFVKKSGEEERMILPVRGLAGQWGCLVLCSPGKQEGGWWLMQYALVETCLCCYRGLWVC